MRYRDIPLKLVVSLDEELLGIIRTREEIKILIEDVILKTLFKTQLLPGPEAVRTTYQAMGQAER